MSFIVFQHKIFAGIAQWLVRLPSKQDIGVRFPLPASYIKRTCRLSACPFDMSGQADLNLVWVSWCLCYFTASLSALPARNFGVVVAPICTFSPVRGLTPMRAARFFVMNTPNPVIPTSSPLASDCIMQSNTHSTASSADFLVPPSFVDTMSTMPALFIVFLF